MIQEFFEKPVNREKLRNDLFDGLEVSKNRKNMRDFHKYPVIYLNFKDDESNNYESAIEYLKDKISDLFKYQGEKINIENLKNDEQTKWKKIKDMKENETGLTQSIRFLCDCLIKFYKRKCIVLIDEYDKALMNSFEKKYYDEMYSIIKSLFSNTFKGNDNLYFGITTGCLPLGLNSFYSGVNNFYECSLLKDQYFNDCYGFTENELNKILSDFGITHTDDQRDMIRKKYDGYTCHTNGQGTIKNLYNPFSIMNFIKEYSSKKGKKIEYGDFWCNSGKEIIIKKTIEENELSFTKNFLSLLYGNIIVIEAAKEIVLKENYNEDEIMIILLDSRYLTLSDEKEYKKNINNMDDQMTKALLNKIEVNNLSLDEPESTEEYENSYQIEKYKHKIINEIEKKKRKYV
ncbi:hypothetical protein BCR36DRAFT_587405, partial [Piromyces finnis]